MPVGEESNVKEGEVVLGGVVGGIDLKSEGGDGMKTDGVLLEDEQKIASDITTNGTKNGDTKPVDTPVASTKKVILKGIKLLKTLDNIGSFSQCRYLYRE